MKLLLLLAASASSRPTLLLLLAPVASWRPILFLLLAALPVLSQRPGSSTALPCPERGIASSDAESKGRPQDPDKLDADIKDPDKSYPVFVRMADQFIAKGGDYETFCRDHAKDKRGDNRKLVLKTLKEKSDKSWAALKERIAKLQESGALKSLARFWIVNGFACELSGKAAQELAADAAVSFIYLQRGPPQIRQHHLASREPQKLTDDQSKAMAAVLKSLEEKEPAFDPKGLEIPWNLQQIQADKVWTDEKAAGEGIVVAVADSGLLAIPPLTRALWKNPAEEPNGKDDDGNGYVDDVFGYDFGEHSGSILGDAAVPHGSACSGIIAGRPTADKALVTRVAPRARIMLLRGMGYLKAYEYALENGADALSMSYMWVNMELGHYRGLFRTAHEHLAAGGVVSLGGAGNFARNAPAGKQITVPKDIPCVIAAAGVVKDGSQPAFSSRGPCSWKGVKFYDDDKPLIKPDVTTFNAGFPCWTTSAFAKRSRFEENWKSGDGSYGLYTGLQGNSFAGPHVAGVVALMLSANPDLNAWEVKEILESTCKDLGDKGRDVAFGAGLVNALDAVRAARKVKK